MIIFEEDISISSIKCVLDKPDPKNTLWLTNTHSGEGPPFGNLSSFVLFIFQIGFMGTYNFLTVFLILNYKSLFCRMDLDDVVCMGNKEKKISRP